MALYQWHRCWKQNVLATTLRFWWRIWPFSSPTSYIFKHKRRSTTFKRFHQYRHSVTNIQKIVTDAKSSITCHQLLRGHIILSKPIFHRYFKTFKGKRASAMQTLHRHLETPTQILKMNYLCLFPRKYVRVWYHLKWF